ncbi:signal peptidase complex subunit 1 [Nematocida sp. AWRm80]|nr:signal peptidase complex subunit 1 [Nematocida sp. AWRm80]
MDYISSMFDRVSSKLCPEIDYVGQELASKLAHTILVVSVPVSLLVGIVSKSIFYLFYTYALMVILCFGLVGPAWPMYRRNTVVFGDKKTQ